jgi:hypothetical protein
MSNPLFILVAGPYRSNTGDDPARISENFRVMARAALELFRKGHLPVLGESLALPLIEEAGSKRIGDAVFDQIFHPVSRMLVERVDAVLRLGGPSRGADEMLSIARQSGKQIFEKLSEIPTNAAIEKKEAE